jgi:hypothetical protein
MPAGKLLVLLGWHLILTGLPLAAAVLFAARRGLRSVPVLLAIGLAASGVAAMLAFWAYYADPFIGEVYAYLLFFGSLGLAAWCLYDRRPETRLLKDLATPLGLWMLGTAFLVFLGFLHGGADSPLATAATRFSGQLPTDNDIPQYFSDWFFHHGHVGTPPEFPGEWLSSDRPPLQVGYVLSQRIFGWDDTGLHYQVLGVALQQLWIIGLWALLTAARVGRLTRALAMAAVLLSDVAIVNGFFVWPKLLPTAMLLAAAAVLVTPLWPELRRTAWSAALVAALFGLAMMGHGSSVFGIVPLVVLAAVRGLPSWRWIGVGVLVGIVVIAPWSAYQKYGDPPGNRLTKWMLAGVIDVDGRGTLEAAIDTYSDAGLGGTLDNKGDNFETMAGGAPMVSTAGNALDAVGADDLATAAGEVRTILFFYLFPSLGLFLLAPLLMAIARLRRPLDSDEWRLALACFAILLIGAATWGVLLFGGSQASTVIHQGSYLLPVAGICGAVVGLRAAFPRFAVYAVLASVLLMFALYIPSLDPQPASAYSLWAALLSGLALAGFALTSLRAD